MTSNYPVDIYTLGPSSLLLVRRGDETCPPLAVDAPFSDNGLAPDVLILSAEGGIPFMEAVKEQGRTVRTMRNWSAGDKVPVLVFEEGELELVGLSPSQAHYLGLSTKRRRSEIITDTIGIVDMASRLYVSPSTASNWPYRRDFPEATHDSPRRWRWIEVEEWAANSLSRLNALREWGFKTGRLVAEETDASTEA